LYGRRQKAIGGARVDQDDSLELMAAGERPAAASCHHASAPASRGVLGRIGSLETRLARDGHEVRQAQALRHVVFRQQRQHEPCALAGDQAAIRGEAIDSDAWDAVCDHLLVIDREGGGERIVGTYRFLTSRTAARAAMPFYTAQEFEIGPVMARHGHLEFMELGRSCVLPQWRNKRTMELMWHGVWAHVLENRVDVLIGCASFPGTNARDFAEPLSFLHHYAAPHDGWDVRARGAQAVTTNLMAREKLETKRALHALPPLIKGYLRLGARFAREAAVDPEFGTTDVLVILPVSTINPRYVEHYGADAGRYAV
jgi:putative hemolysin